MKTIVLKFGGSSVSNNDNLKIVANKIIEMQKKNDKIVVIVSAQGKTTDILLEQAKEISELPNQRELDSLLSTGEQITAAKLAILLNNMKHAAISLNGWQIPIKTNENHGNAKIIKVNKKRINQELNNGKIVVISGFQGISNNLDITTLGRGGSDTTAVAIAIELKAKTCYIFSDVDGIYSSDPRIIDTAEKINYITYNEMLEASFEGAKVLHDKCVAMAKENNLQIVASSTFNNSKGTLIADTAKINSIIKEENIKKATKTKDKTKEESKVEIKDKSNGKIKDKNTNINSHSTVLVIKNDKLMMVEILSNKELFEIINIVNNNNIKVKDIIKTDSFSGFIINKEDREGIEQILLDYKYKINPISKISIVSNKMIGEYKINTITQMLKKEEENIISINVSVNKISIIFNEIISNECVKLINDKLLNN